MPFQTVINKLYENSSDPPTSSKCIGVDCSEKIFLKIRAQTDQYPYNELKVGQEPHNQNKRVKFKKILIDNSIRQYNSSGEPDKK